MMDGVLFLLRKKKKKKYIYIFTRETVAIIL